MERGGMTWRWAAIRRQYPRVEFWFSRTCRRYGRTTTEQRAWTNHGCCAICPFWGWSSTYAFTQARWPVLEHRSDMRSVESARIATQGSRWCGEAFPTRGSQPSRPSASRLRPDLWLHFALNIYLLATSRRDVDLDG